MIKYFLEPSEKVTILFLSWRDIKAPKSGGAEVYTHEMLKRVNKNKYRIVHLSPLFEGGKEIEEIDGVTYIRNGNELSVISFAIVYYLKNKDIIHYVVDQCNTHRFFTKFWVSKGKRIFFIHQLTREIWYIHANFPINYIGAWTETFFLRLSRKDYTMTVSQSTKNDLIDIGFTREKTVIIPEGIQFEHWPVEKFCEKEDVPTFIYVGRFAYYKGIDAAIQAFGMLKRTYPKARLWIVGKKNTDYIKKTLRNIFNKYNLSDGSPEENSDVIFWGFVPEDKKLELMSRAHALLFPSIREGWGLIVTEAAAVGTPSIVYKSPGIIDAVDFGQAGYLTKTNTEEELTKLMKDAIEDKDGYRNMRIKAYEYSRRFHWDKTAIEFEKFMENIIKRKG